MSDKVKIAKNKIINYLFEEEQQGCKGTYETKEDMLKGFDKYLLEDEDSQSGEHIYFSVLMLKYNGNEDRIREHLKEISY